MFRANRGKIQIHFGPSRVATRPVACPGRADGIAPSRIEFLEQRTLPWPGFETAQECFLFRFGYTMSDGEFSNVGLAGPVAKAFSQDLANISTDDAFAIFADGTLNIRRFTNVMPVVCLLRCRSRFVNGSKRLCKTSLSTWKPAFVGTFFEQLVLVGFGTRDDRKQPFAYDGTELVVCPS